MEDNKNEEFNENEEVNNIEEVSNTNDDAVESSKNTEAGEELLNIEQPKENKIVPIIATIMVGIVGVAIIVLAVLSILSPKNNFFRLVNKSFNNISKGVSVFEDSVFGKLLAIDTSSKLNVKANVLGNINTQDAEIKEWFNGVENFEIKANENIDFSNEYKDGGASFILNGEKILDGKLVKNKNIMSLKLEDITDGYITVDNNNLETLWEKIGVNGPRTLDNSYDILKDINFSKKDINNLMTTVEKFGIGFSRAFEDEDFSYGNGSVTYDEGSIDCKTMDFVINAVDFNNGIIKGLEEVVSKEKYIDSLYKVVSTLDKVSGYEPFSREEFGTNLEEMLEQVRSLEFSEDDLGFIIRIYYKGNDILKFELRSGDYNTVMFDFICINNKESGYYRFSDGMTIYEDKVTTIEDLTTHIINVDYINYETGEILEGYGSEITIKIDSSKKNEQTASLEEKVRLVSYDTDFETLDIMSVTPTVVKNYILKGSIDGDNNLVELSMVDGDGTYTSTFNVNATIKENAEFSNLVINDAENFDVTKKSDEEIIAKKDKVVSNWNSSLIGNKDKFSQFEMIVSMYLSMFIPTDYYGGNEDAGVEELNLDEFQVIG